VSTSSATKPKAKRPHWIAERTLKRVDTVGGLVVVRMGCPEWPPGAEEWRCAFEIRGIGDDKIHFAHGIETMDTLQNTLSGIRSVLGRSGIPLRWECMEGDNIGFSKYVDQGFGLAFEQRLERVILVEVEKQCGEAHNCTTNIGLRVAMLEAKHGSHGLLESAKRMLAKAREANESASATSKVKRSRWIATRTLVCFEHGDRRVVVRIGRPEMDPGGFVWRCPFEIRGLPEETRDFGYGVDSIHALQNALHGIRSVILASTISMQWEGVKVADPGFPMAIPMEFGLEFEQRIIRRIADEIEERVRPLRERYERQQARRKAPKKP